MSDEGKLRQTLNRIDGRGYKAYQDIRGEYQLGNARLVVDHVQGDPFAAPSRMRLIMDQSDLNLPAFREPMERTALEDFLARRFRQQIRRSDRRGSGSGKSGQVEIDAGGQQIIERTACRLIGDHVELRISVGLPARGRTVLGRTALQLLTDELPKMARAALTLQDNSEAEGFIQTAVDAEALRSQLPERNLVSFVANGANLPRQSGVSDRPLQGEVVPFQSPESLEVTLDTPHSGSVTGMGVPVGVALIVGGGFHGKSTLLEALSSGVYNHVPGDGREKVVTRADAVKIRAEDGRSVAGNDLSGFIGRLPLGRTTDEFSTENASGSTSQAANILEALEAGSQLLLMDEDTCATNFMIRDDIMRRLVPDEAEPITPFIDRVRQLSDEAGVSTVLVMGGAGDYFAVADTVIWMDEYRPHEVSERAKAIVSGSGGRPVSSWPGVVKRVPEPSTIDPTRRNRTKVRARGTEEVGFGQEQIDLRQVEQIVDSSQTRGIAEVLVYAIKNRVIDGEASVAEILDAIESHIDSRGLDSMSSHRGHPGDYARPRRHEIAAALNRLRTLRVQQRSRNAVSSSPA